MHELPKNLDVFYDRILLELEQDESHQEAHRALQWLIFAARPVSLKELAEAVIIRPEPPYLDLKDRFMDYMDLLDILPSGLVSAVQVKRGRDDDIAEFSDSEEASDDNDDEEATEDEKYEDEEIETPSKPYDEAWERHDETVIESDMDETTYKVMVRLAHFSVEEYLLSTRIKTGMASIYYIEETSAHSIIAQSCFSYLLFVGSQKPELAKEIFKLFPLVHYTANCWPYHMQKLDGLLGTEPKLSEMAGLCLKYKSDAWKVWAAVGFRDSDYCDGETHPLTDLPLLKRQVIKVSTSLRSFWSGILLARHYLNGMTLGPGVPFTLKGREHVSRLKLNVN
jgi:hypothetical protein